MAFSSSEGKLCFRDWLIHMAKPLGYTRFLDIGCGAGLYGQIIREVLGKTVGVDAVEVFQEYIFRHQLGRIYDKIICRDIREICGEIGIYDLIVWGDGPEHFERSEVERIMGFLKDRCRFIWTALPIKIEGKSWSAGYFQGEEEWQENSFNRHQSDWSFDDFCKTFKPLFAWAFIQTGSFLIEGTIK